jgi:hypothetical protein
MKERMRRGSEAGSPSVSRLPKYSGLRDLQCIAFGHDEDFPLFERIGCIKTCSNCHRTFRWTGKQRWEELGGGYPKKAFSLSIREVVAALLLSVARVLNSSVAIQHSVVRMLLRRVDVLLRDERSGVSMIDVPVSANETLGLRILGVLVAFAVIVVLLLLLPSCASSSAIPTANCGSIAYVQFSMPGQVDTCQSGAAVLKYEGRTYLMTCGSVISLLYAGDRFTVNGQAMKIPAAAKCDEFGGLLVTIVRRSASGTNSSERQRARMSALTATRPTGVVLTVNRLAWRAA